MSRKIKGDTQISIAHNQDQYKVSLQRLISCSHRASIAFQEGQTQIIVTDNFKKPAFDIFISLIKQQPIPLDPSLMNELVAILFDWEIFPTGNPSLFNQLEQQIIQSQDYTLVLAAFAAAPGQFTNLAFQINSNYEAFKQTPLFPTLPAAALACLAYGQPVVRSLHRQEWLIRFQNIIEQKEAMAKQEAEAEAKRVSISKELVQARQANSEAEHQVKTMREELKKESIVLDSIISRTKQQSATNMAVLAGILKDSNDKYNSANKYKPLVAKWHQWKTEVDSARSRYECSN